jgi:diguanylate cyclase (GGDEF)-like protein
MAPSSATERPALRPHNFWAGTLIAGLLLAAFVHGTAEGTVENSIQSLVDHAATLSQTRSPAETLAFLDANDELLSQSSWMQQARLELIRARAHALIGDYETGLQILMGLMEKDLEPPLQLRALELAANLSMELSRFEEAFGYLNQGLIVQEDIDDDGLKSGIFGLAAYWHSQLGDREKGLEYADRTLSLAQASGEIREVCVALEKLGQAQEMAGQLDLAMVSYEAGLEACQKANDPVFTGVMHMLMGRLLHEMGQTSAAEEWLQRGIEKTHESGFAGGAADGIVTYSRLLLDQQRHDEALPLLNAAFDQFLLEDRPQNYSDAYLMLAQIKAHQGDYRQAFENLSRHLQGREEYLGIERAKLIAFQEVQFDARSKEQEIQLLREQARVSALQEVSHRQQQRLQQLAYAMVGFVLVLLLFLLFRVIGERRHFRRLSDHDGLTGLLNHTCFFATSERVLTEAVHNQLDLTLVLADIDLFKQVNDRHGHLVGDQVLRKVAQCFKEAFARHGPVGRIGGEEFAVSLAARTQSDAVALVTDLQQQLKRCRMDGLDQPVTMSFGIAQLRPGETLESLRARADEALYRSKHLGRNQVNIADIPSTE